MTSKARTGSAVPRHLIFVMSDGSYVVQWDERRVQDLLTGRYRAYTDTDFGHPITDYELTQLKTAGRVEHFNRAFIWLYALPESNRFGLRVQERTFDRVRGYYINTTLHESNLDEIEQLLSEVGLSSRLMPVARSEMIAIVKRDGMPFLHLKDAELAQQQVEAAARDVFGGSVIAFVDLPAGNSASTHGQTGELLDLSALIASQTDTSLTEGRRAVIACQQPDEYGAAVDVLREMKMVTRVVTSGRDALQLLEDFSPSLLITELDLNDMHGWQLLGTIREISTLRNLLTIVVAEAGTTPDYQSFGVGVAKVAAFMVKPLSLSRLRHSVWLAFTRRAEQGL